MLSTENVKFEYKGKTYTRNFLAKEAEKNNMEVDAYINVLVGRGMKQISEPAEMIDGGFFEDLWKSATQGWAAGASVNESFDIYKKGANVSDEELEEGSEFELGIMKFKINRIKTYEKNLIKL